MGARLIKEYLEGLFENGNTVKLGIDTDKKDRFILESVTINNEMRIVT